MLAGEELHDGLTILRHLKERLSQTAIRKKIRSATDGAFLTRADSPKVHYLFKQLIQKAKASGDSVLEAWLRGVQEEENIHEMLVSKMLRSLGVEYEFKRNPPDKRLVSSFLKMGSGFFFSQTADGFEGSLRAFRRMADSAHKVRGAVMHIRRNLTLAAYTYRPW